MASSYKQVIVVRHDLHMRMGKVVAQGAHASMMFLINHALNSRGMTGAETAWIFESAITKICVRVESEEELLNIHALAKEAGLTCNLITDAGYTEFDGPTKTCLAIGPDAADKIDAITGKLRLL